MANVISYTPSEAAEAQVKDHRPVPFILSDADQYPRYENKFLRERACGQWRGGKYVGGFGLRKELSDSTTLAYAKDLADFYSYQECRGAHFDRTDASSLLKEYREDLRSGSWSRASKRVAESTWTRRSMLAEDFLLWSVANGIIETPALEQPPSRRKARRAAGHGGKRQNPTGRARGRGIRSVRKDPEDLEIPTLVETNAFLLRVHERHGAARGGACAAIITVGLRLEEASLLRAAQLPKPKANDDWVFLNLCYGTKGRRRIGDASKRGKPRRALVHRTALDEMIRYRDGPRKLAVAGFKAANPGAKPPPELFLDEVTGRPLSVHTIYRAWTGCRAPLAKGWSPHPGRHVYAMRLALSHLGIEDGEHRLPDPNLHRIATLERARFVIEIIVQPSLGHEDEATTRRYLKWLGRIVAVRGLAAAYADHLASSLVP